MQSPSPPPRAASAGPTCRTGRLQCTRISAADWAGLRGRPRVEGLTGCSQLATISRMLEVRKAGIYAKWLDGLRDIPRPGAGSGSGRTSGCWKLGGCQARGRRSLGTSDRLRTRLPGVLQTAEPHDRRAVGRRRQTDSESGYRDGATARAKPVGGYHEQDRYYTL